MKPSTIQVKYIDRVIKELNKLIPPSSLCDNPHRLYLYKGNEYVGSIKPYSKEKERFENCIEKSENKVWGKKVSGKWNGYPPIIQKAMIIHYDFQKIKRVVNSGKLVLDGLLTLSLKKIKSNVDNVVVYKAEWLKRGRGISAKFVSGYIAEHRGYIYHHTKRDKIENKVIQKRKRRILLKYQARIVKRLKTTSLDKIFVTKQDSINAGNCQSGTINWINRHNLQDRESISCQELLDLNANNFHIQTVINYALVQYAKKNIKKT